MTSTPASNTLLTLESIFIFSILLAKRAIPSAPAPKPVPIIAIFFAAVSNILFKFPKMPEIFSNNDPVFSTLSFISSVADSIVSTGFNNCFTLSVAVPTVLDIDPIILSALISWPFIELKVVVAFSVTFKAFPPFPKYFFTILAIEENTVFSPPKRFPKSS